MTEQDLQGKYVVAFDTVCEGNQTWKDDDGLPVLYNSREEAYKEIFDTAFCLIQVEVYNKKGKISKKLLEDFNEDNDVQLTEDMIDRMKGILVSGDVNAMENFAKTYPDYLQHNEEWVEEANQFLMERKAFFTGQGIVIEGKTLVEIFNNKQ